MARSELSLETIAGFLSQKRIAFVGISRAPGSIGAELLKEFERRGMEVLLVNPKATELFGRRCYARVQEIDPAADAALVLTSPSTTTAVVRDCVEAGIRRVWMYRGGFGGAVNNEAVEFCRANGVELVAGECPFMFMEPVKHVHRVHRFFYKIAGKYPVAG